MAATPRSVIPADSNARPRASESLRLLLVEDSPSDARLLIEELNDALGEQLSLVQVPTLHAALPRLHEETFDVILTDLNLPDSVGAETISWLHNAAPEVPIIVTTTEREPTLMRQLFYCGAQDFLVKGEYAGWMLMRAIHASMHRKRALIELDSRQHDLRQSEQRIQEIIETSASAFVVVDMKGIVRYANDVAIRMFRRTAPFVVGGELSFASRLDPEQPLEIAITCPDGSRGCAEAVAVLATWDGAPAYLVSISDITERKNALDELQTTTVRLRAALEGGGGIGTWDLDVATRRITWDEAIASLLGLHARFKRGIRMRALLPMLHPDDRSRVVASFQEALANTGDIDLEFRLCPAPGRVLWISIKAHADHIENGRPTRITGACLDISSRKSAEESQVRGQKLEALGSLAAGIAHDFNNILAAINGNVMLAMDGTATEEARMRLETVRQAGARAVDLVQQILSFSRPTEVVHRPIDIVPIMEEAQRMLRAAIPVTVDLRWFSEPGLPLVKVDGTQIHQILVNLVTNAWHAIGAHKRGSVSVSAAPAIVNDEEAARLRVKQGPYVMLSVADSGSGMDEATRSRIFDPFFTTKPAGQGTGLGLSVVHGIVQSAGGAIAVDSELGKGTKFDLYFPAQLLPTISSLAESDGKESPIPYVRGQRVMFVDDDPILTDLGVDVLEQIGYLVTGFCNPHKALRTFGEHPELFDVVVTDIGMPKMSGIDFCRRLLEIRPEIPIVVLTGSIKPEDRASVEALGVKVLATKPHDISTVSALIQKALKE